MNLGALAVLVFKSMVIFPSCLFFSEGQEALRKSQPLVDGLKRKLVFLFTALIRNDFSSTDFLKLHSFSPFEFALKFLILLLQDEVLIAAVKTCKGKKWKAIGAYTFIDILSCSPFRFLSCRVRLFYFTQPT